MVGFCAEANRKPLWGKLSFSVFSVKDNTLSGLFSSSATLFQKSLYFSSFCAMIKMALNAEAELFFIKFLDGTLVLC